jgi:copper(I)-binding protein
VKSNLKVWIALVSSCIILACTPQDEEPHLNFENAWIRALPPGSMMTAGFGSLINAGDVDLEIGAFSSPVFGDVSLHQTIDKGGVSHMQSVPELSLAAGATLTLEPGGYHLMLMKPGQDVSDGVQIDIEVADGTIFSFELPIERR